jgi:hypothetical protein
VAKRQAYYDGALGARGIHIIQSFGGDSDTIIMPIPLPQPISTATSMYTTHLTQLADPRNSPEYHMTEFGGWDSLVLVNSFGRELAPLETAESR